jgi:hypothetical protein
VPVSAASAASATSATSSAFAASVEATSGSKELALAATGFEGEQPPVGSGASGP